jgi:hypothetical protein
MMTLTHRLTAAYAIVITALLLGIGHGNRHLLALEAQRPDLSLTQANQNHIAARFTVPYLVGGVLVAAAFLTFTRQVKRRGIKIEEPNTASHGTALPRRP